MGTEITAAAPEGLRGRSLQVAPAALVGLNAWAQAPASAAAAPQVLRVA